MAPGPGGPPTGHLTHRRTTPAAQLPEFTPLPAGTPHASQSTVADNPHDALFQETFGDPKEAAAELGAILPADVVALFDWDRLALERGNLVRVDGRRFCDLLFRVPRTDGGDPALVFVLFEHQSSSDPLMPLRVLGYMVKIWEAWAAKNKANGLPLPFVLPVVLSHDERGWRAATSMGALFDPAPQNHVLQPFVPDFGFVIDDIAQVSDQELFARALPPAAMLTVWALRDGRTPARLLAHVPSFAPVFEQFAHDRWFQDVLDRLLIYLGQAAGSRSLAPRTFVDVVAKHAPGAKRAVMNTLEKFIERHRQEGLEEGLELGVTRGKRAALLHQLELKFGAITEAQLERVERAPAAELDRYVERVLTADSLDAVFGG